jgi:hypothetical protein
MIGGLVSHSFRGTIAGQKLIMAAGCFYRYQDAIIPMVQFAYDNWALTMSYDVTAYGRRLHLNGPAGYELSLNLRGNYHHRPSTELKCPRFEHELGFDGEEDL